MGHEKTRGGGGRSRAHHFGRHDRLELSSLFARQSTADQSSKGTVREIVVVEISFDVADVKVVQGRRETACSTSAFGGDEGEERGSP